MKLSIGAAILSGFTFIAQTAVASSECHAVGYFGFLATTLQFSVSTKPKCFGPNSAQLATLVPTQVKFQLSDAGTSRTIATVETRTSDSDFKIVGKVINFQNWEDHSADDGQRCYVMNPAALSPEDELGSIELAVKDKTTSEESWFGLARTERKFSAYKIVGNSRCDFELQLTESR